ncbi:MAG: VanW family protein [Acetivibrio sp.]
MKKIKSVVIAVITIGAILAGILIAVTAFAGNDKNTICKGVWINTIDVSEMTEEEAKEALEEQMASLEEKKLTVIIDENKVETTVSTLGIRANIEDTIKTAVQIGKNGNFIKRYKEIKDLENQAKIIPLKITFDRESLKAFVEEKCSSFNIPPQNAQLSRINGSFVVKEHKLGRKILVEDTIAEIEEIYGENWDYEDAEIKAVVVDDEPKYTEEKLALCKDVLGTFSTTYSTSSSSRANNLANAARLIDGSIIWPGEIFSTGKTMQPITVENGYSIASAYENGQVVDSIGGGVCQVATTLYNAVLKAEIEVTERSNHSMMVGYVEASMDAAIAGDYKDLKIRNDTEVPIYIEAATVGRTITFTIYGQETRDIANRRVEYESKVLKVIQPGKDKITKDKTQPKTYRKVTQSAHVGYKAELWKIVYEKDVEVSRERVNYSNYAAEPAYVTIGTKKEEEEKSVKPKHSKEPLETLPPSETLEPGEEIPEEIPGENLEDLPEATPGEEIQGETPSVNTEEALPEE